MMTEQEMQQRWLAVLKIVSTDDSSPQTQEKVVEAVAAVLYDVHVSRLQLGRIAAALEQLADREGS